MPEDMEILRDEDDKEQFDASVILGKKPGRYYRWARNNDNNLILRKIDGYEICTDPDVKSMLSSSTRLKKGADVDDTITWGDMILVETSQENHEKLLERERRKIVRRTHGVMNTFKNKIAGAGGKPFEEHGKSAAAEGKGYDKGFTQKDVENELFNKSPLMQQEERSWKGRRE